MRIDAHQHFWRYNKSEYSWISDRMEILKRDFLPDSYMKELEGIGFDGSIAVQARQSHDETFWLLELAGKYDFIKGVVGWIDLCSEKANEHLGFLTKNNLLKGVRHVLQDEPDEGFMLSGPFLRGIGLLKKYNLVYEILIIPNQLSYANQLVSRFPEQQFVLDHIAKPLIKDRILYPWKEEIKKLAEHPNVSCKLSGMVTESEWKGWIMDDFKPYLDIVFNAFGTSRLMIGSDWPVCTVSSDYKTTMKIILDYIQPFKQTEKDMILGNNAVQVYNLLIPKQI
jgi:L-fuconolactonase